MRIHGTILSNVSPRQRRSRAHSAQLVGKLSSQNQRDGHTRHTTTGLNEAEEESGGKGRSATRRKIFDGRAKNGKLCGKGSLNPNNRNDRGNITICRVNLAMCEQGDDTFVIGFISIMVNPLVQRRRSHHRAEQQHQANQRDSQSCLAEFAQMTIFLLQSVCNLQVRHETASFILKVLSFCSALSVVANAGILRLFAFATDIQIKFEPEILRLGIGVLFELDDEIIVFTFG